MKTFASFFGALILSSALSLPARPEDRPPSAMPQYLYVLHLVPRLRDEKAWMPADQAVVDRHLAHLQAASVAGQLVLAGRTQEPLNQTFGIAIFETPDDAAARAFMLSDPAVSEGIMTAELHPYRIAAQCQL